MIKKDVMNTDSDICPFVRKPFSECHCFDMTSRNIDSAIHYCVNHFQSCEIFQMKSVKKISGHETKPGFKSLEAS